MLGTGYQETGKVVKLVLSQVHALAVCRHRCAAPCHEVWGRVREEQEVVHSPPLGCLHEPSLSCLFCEVPRAVGRKEAFRPVPAVVHTLCFAVLVTARTYVHAPVGESHAYGVALLVELTLEQQVGYPLLLLLGPVLAYEVASPCIRSAEVVYHLVGDVLVYLVHFAVLCISHIRCKPQCQRDQCCSQVHSHIGRYWLVTCVKLRNNCLIKARQREILAERTECCPVSTPLPQILGREIVSLSSHNI